MRKNIFFIITVGLSMVVCLMGIIFFMKSNSKTIWINEVCSKNEHVFADGSGNYYDYIELYNASKDTIDLSGYGLSDKAEEPYRYTFSDITIKSGGYLIILATKKETDYISTGFGLDADEGNMLFLSDPQGNLVDEVEIPAMKMDTVYARRQDGGEELAVMLPSPSMPNQSLSVYTDVEAPVFSLASGFYDDEIKLEITCPDEEAKIYYTLDGSVPNSSSLYYQDPITLHNVSEQPNVYSARTDISASNKYVPANPVNKANIIRAVAYHEDGNHSIIRSGTYFVGLDQKGLYGDVPVISIITDPYNLFDYNNGIYVLGQTYDNWLAADSENAKRPEWEIQGNFTNKGDLWEKEVSLEYILPDGTIGVSQNMGIRIKGNTSRTHIQKSFKLLAKKKYGDSKVSYELIPDNLRSDGKDVVKEYDTFVLRTGGNDYERTKYRDVFLQQLIGERNIETQQSIPCVVYLDGEYWGVYTLMEDYSDSYFAENYGIDAKNVVMIKVGQLDEGKESDFELYQEMYDFITNNDMSMALNYDKAKEYLDIDNFVQYYAFQLYVHNHDDKNNWGMWRVRDVVSEVPDADGKWRMYLYDTEYSANIFGEDKDAIDDNISPYFSNKTDDKSQEYYEIFKALYTNKEFRELLINTLCDIRNYDFETGHVMEFEKQIGDEYAKLAPESIYRNGPEWAANRMNPAEYYEQKRDELRSFFYDRYDVFMDIISDALNAGKYTDVSVSVSDSSVGTVQINSTLLDLSRFDEDTFKGSYFVDIPIMITAIPEEGYHFVRWEVDGGVIEDATSANTTIEIEKNCKVVAIFEK